MHVRDLDETELEAALRDAGWTIEEIEMEPTVRELPLCDVDMMGRPVGGATRVDQVLRRSVLLATKGDQRIGNCYDRDAHGKARAVAMLYLCLGTGVAEELELELEA